jgi:type IV secretion system protein VirB9
MKTSTTLAAAIAAFILASPATAQQSRNDLAATNRAALQKPSDASLVGALHEFAYERGALYAIQASPQRITDIALEQGERCLGLGRRHDTLDCRRRPLRRGASDAGPRAGQPNAPSLATNLVIMTDRRVYHVELKSVAGPAMAAVSWRYPADLILQNQLPPQAQAPSPPPFTPEALNLRYRISGAKPDWRPLAAIDDGQQVFIEMPERIHTMEAPPLFVIGDQGAELVNYRVQGNYYVVDRLFAKAELRLGSGWGAKVVTIERQTPISATRAANTTGARNG